MHIPALICATSGQISNETHQATAILHSLCVVGAGGGGIAGSVIIQTSTTTSNTCLFATQVNSSSSQQRSSLTDSDNHNFLRWNGGNSANTGLAMNQPTWAFSSAVQVGQMSFMEQMSSDMRSVDCL